jgi:hypothetical protein
MAALVVGELVAASAKELMLLPLSPPQVAKPAGKEANGRGA